MSTIVVTPPAAAVAVARATPSPGALPVCTWASTWPGRIRCPVGTSIRSAPLSSPGAASAAMRPCATPISPSSIAPPGETKRPLTTRSSIAGVYARSVAGHAVLQIDTEHPSAFGAGPARWRERLRRRLEAASGRPVDVVHYLDAGDLGDAHAIVLSGSSAPWAAHDAAALARLGEAIGASGRPVLGICAGMQLLGRFAGGRIEHAPEPEIG